MSRLRKTRQEAAALGLLIAFLAAVLALLATTADGAEVGKDRFAEDAEIGEIGTRRADLPQQSCPTGTAPEVPRSARQNLALAFANDSRAVVDGRAGAGVQRRARGAGAGRPMLARRSVNLAGPVDARRGNCHVTIPAGVLNPSGRAKMIAWDEISGLRPAGKRDAWQLLPAVGRWWDSNANNPAAKPGRGLIFCPETTCRQAGFRGGAVIIVAETSRTSGGHTPSSSRANWLARAALALRSWPGTGLQADQAPARPPVGRTADACGPG